MHDDGSWRGLVSACAKWLPLIGLAAALFGGLSACGQADVRGAAAPDGEHRGVRTSEEGAQTALFALG